MNTSDLLTKFKYCEKLTNEELETLAKGLQEIVDATVGKGVYFTQTYLFAVYELQRVTSMLDARKHK